MYRSPPVHPVRYGVFAACSGVKGEPEMAKREVEYLSSLKPPVSDVM